MSKKKNKKRTKEERKAYFKKCGIAFLVLSVVGTLLMTGVLSENRTMQYPDPTEYFYIEDCSGVFTEETENFIFEQAYALQEATQAQVVVVAIPDTLSDSLEDYAYELANGWGIGDAELDNGVLLLFTTTEAHVRLEIGRGLEGCLTDGKSGRILDTWAVDAMNDGRWNEAAVNTFVAVASEVYGEYGIEVPENLTPVDSVSEEVSATTMADAEFPEELVIKNESSLLEQMIAAWCVFWVFAILPFLYFCVRFYFGVSISHTHYDDRSTWSSDDSGTYSGGDSISGGGGSFGGGGASR